MPPRGRPDRDDRSRNPTIGQVSRASRRMILRGGAGALAAALAPVGIAGNMPAFRHDASSSAAEQAAQMGMHHDGIHFFALTDAGTRGLLAMNHEYTDDGLLHVDGTADWSAAKVAKSQAAHGRARARHTRQLRGRQDSMGHLPVGRGELGVLLRYPRADANRSPSPRRGMTMRVMPTTSHFDRALAGEKARAMNITDHAERPVYLMRGIDRCGKNRFINA